MSVTLLVYCYADMKGDDHVLALCRHEGCFYCDDNNCAVNCKVSREQNIRVTNSQKNMMSCNVFLGTSSQLFFIHSMSPDAFNRFHVNALSSNVIIHSLVF